MWSYYGSKSKIVDFYPRPKFGKIIEPFAGSARYALRWFDREVLLIDKYPVIIEIWRWLQSATENDILDLPDLQSGDDIRNYEMPRGARLLIGFCINGGSVSPKNTVCDFQNWNADKRRIAKDLYKIKHWEIREGSYEDLDNEEATWFIDPPYQYGGEHYKVSNKLLNYSALAEWCKSRNGQSIVCENTRADWLPFYAMRQMRGAYFSNTEAIWSNYPTDFDAVQLNMFDFLGENNE